MATFTVLIPGPAVPAVAADTPSWQRKPAIWTAPAALIPTYLNVYKLNDGTYTTVPPQWEDVAVFYQGGTTVTVSAAEAVALTAAGYGSYLS